jgi:HlyD family secretion protein
MKKKSFNKKVDEEGNQDSQDKVKNQKELDKAQKENNIEVVFMNKNGVSKLQTVKVGIQDNNNIEIISGLDEGDEVISAPYSVISKTLKDNDKIKVVKKEELFGADKKK